MIERLALASVNHRYRTVLVWLTDLIGVVVVSGMASSSFDVNDRLDGSDAQRAYDLAAAHMPSVTGISTTVVFKTDELALTAAVVREISALPRIAAAIMVCVSASFMVADLRSINWCRRRPSDCVRQREVGSHGRDC
jgi:hypothetical protein